MPFVPFQNLYQHVKRSDPRLYEALDRIIANIQTLTNAPATTSSTTNIVQSLFLSLTLTNNTFVASPAYPTDGSLLIVKLLQDGLGGRFVNWDAAFGTVPDLGSLDGGTYSTITFVGENARWWLVSAVINQSQ